MYPELSRSHVLLVDDDVPNLDALSRVLKAHSKKVTCAQCVGDGLKALYLGKSQDAVVDVILTDLRMPERDGIDFIRAIRAHYPLIPVVVMTGYGTVQQAVSAMKLGAFDFIEKPIKKEALCTVLERALKNSETIPPEPKNLELLGENDRPALSLAMRKVHELVEYVAPTMAHVLITGQSGTGKELIAKRIVEHSLRKNKPYIQIHCGALPDNLLESELFGHEKGAFTGASSTKIGLFEAADGGTVLLDEVGEMSPTMQVKLLRFLQDGMVRKVGSNVSRKVDVRVLSATHRDLEARVKDGFFREDLRYRLEVVQIRLPRLAERVEDFSFLCSEIIETLAKKNGVSTPLISNNVFEEMKTYSWPGNVRELYNFLERALVMESDQGVITTLALPSEQAVSPPPFLKHHTQGTESDSVSVPVGTSLRDLEELMIKKTLDATQGDKILAARLLGIHSKTLARRFRSGEA